MKLKLKLDTVLLLTVLRVVVPTFKTDAPIYCGGVLMITQPKSSATNGTAAHVIARHLESIAGSTVKSGYHNRFSKPNFRAEKFDR